MQVRVLFFGMLKDVTGVAQEQAEFADSSTVRDVFERYAERFTGFQATRSFIRAACNHEFCTLDTALAEGDEIAFLPPVSGGSGVHVSITRDPIDSRAVVQAVQTEEDGAVATFEGVVRNNTRGRLTQCLDYEGYEPMALRVMSGIGEELLQKHKITRIAMTHRLGRLHIGEASVVIAVSAPHRKPAFDAALDAINLLKKKVPIWKKEHFADGEVWVEGEWDASSLPA